MFLHLSKLSYGNLRFAPGLKLSTVVATMCQPGGRSEISARAEIHHVIRSLDKLGHLCAH